MLGGITYLTFTDVHARYGGALSKSRLYELTRRSEIPHRKLPGSRVLLFDANDLQAWEDGATLETVTLAAGGRIVKPMAG